MKSIPRHTHSMELEFSCKGFLLLRVTVPIKLKNPVPLHDLYKKTKAAVANSEGIPIWNIKGSHKKIVSTKYDRILFEWAGGFALDLPDDYTDKDYKIVLHYLEGIKMSIA